MFRKLFLKPLPQHRALCNSDKFLHTSRTTNETSGSSADAPPVGAEVELSQERIDDVLKVTPNLSVISLDSWHRTHETFLNHGVQTTNFLRIVAGNPSVLTRSPQKIVNSLEIWRSCQFGEKSLYVLITKYPELLNVTDSHRLLARIAFLRGFVSTPKNVWRLLMSSPTLIEQSEESIKEKINYITQVMRIEIPEIVKCEALSQTIEEISCRHVFLLRLGLFKPRSPKAHEHEPNHNPRLYQITDSSDKAFATKVCRVSLLEYEVFRELYAREQARKQHTREAESDDD